MILAQKPAKLKVALADVLENAQNTRFASVTAVVRTLTVCRQRVTSNVTILTWGGLRGALAVALALSLPQEPAGERNLLLAATYITVVFSILVQGLTIAPLLRRMQGRLGNVAC